MIELDLQYHGTLYNDIDSIYSANGEGVYRMGLDTNATLKFLSEIRMTLTRITDSNIYDITDFNKKYQFTIWH